MGTSRAKKAGHALAKVLLDRLHGRRPISLVGYSLGARVIFFALEALAGMSGSEGIVANAILLGAAAPSEAHRWNRLRSVVAGRLVNGYSRHDWVLRFVYRAGSLQSASEIAGLNPIQMAGVENVDLSNMIRNHTDYSAALVHILHELEIADTATIQRPGFSRLEPMGEMAPAAPEQFQVEVSQA
eukprot:TRINITY_DN14731_c0_g1_i3.p1 TRINITY_DN14731_c0_g1~~TRINITY_DN14731_c0_g1_i3.p1  ORF type:complete len:185 (+),score=27.86 TRINITY_DN14731_c0_g1_i3:261-815(+)